MKCVVNKKSVSKNKSLKHVSKITRKYYQESFFHNEPNSTRVRIGKLADLSAVSYREISETPVSARMNTKQWDRAAVIELCQETQLTGRSGNGFPVSKKLESFQSQDGTLLINGVECDPGLVTDSWLYRNRQEQIRRGVEILRSAFNLKEVVLATKEPGHTIGGIKQVKVIDRYPMGYENYLVRYALGVELAQGEHPIDRGILVMNLQTMVAIAELAQNPSAGTFKYITVANLVDGTATVARVAIGDSIRNIADRCYSSSLIAQHHLYAGGGAFMVHEAQSDEVIGDITCYIAIGDMPDYPSAGKCKGCKACTKNCPAGVQIHKLVQYVERNGQGDASACAQYNPSACVGCGACTYGCMAGKDVREIVIWARTELLLE